MLCGIGGKFVAPAVHVRVLVLVEVGLRLKRAEAALRCRGRVEVGERVLLLSIVEQREILAIAPSPGVCPGETLVLIGRKLRAPCVHAGRDVACDLDELVVGGGAVGLVLSGCARAFGGLHKASSARVESASGAFVRAGLFERLKVPESSFGPQVVCFFSRNLYRFTGREREAFLERR